MGKTKQPRYYTRPITLFNLTLEVVLQNIICFSCQDMPINISRLMYNEYIRVCVGKVHNDSDFNIDDVIELNDFIFSGKNTITIKKSNKYKRLLMHTICSCIKLQSTSINHKFVVVAKPRNWKLKFNDNFDEPIHRYVSRKDNTCYGRCILSSKHNYCAKCINNIINAVNKMELIK